MLSDDLLNGFVIPLSFSSFYCSSFSLTTPMGVWRGTAGVALHISHSLMGTVLLEAFAFRNTGEWRGGGICKIRKGTPTRIDVFVNHAYLYVYLYIYSLLPSDVLCTTAPHLRHPFFFPSSVFVFSHCAPYKGRGA